MHINCHKTPCNSCQDLDKARKALQKAADDGSLLMSFHKYIEQVKERLVIARNKAYPDHSDHGNCEEIDVEHFDAMMVNVTVLCTCNQKLVIDRDFF